MSPPQPPQPEARTWIARAFTLVEDVVYIGLGLLLAGSALTLLVTGLVTFARSVAAGSLPAAISGLLAQALLILLIVELLYTVQVSFREHALIPEPFLLIGLISAIRRVLLVTAEFGELKDVSPGQFRQKRGGDILLRGIGMSLLARAFIYAKEKGLSYDAVGQHLGKVNWHLLDCERKDLPDTSTDAGRRDFPDAVREHLNPLWASLLVIGESRYRIGSANAEATQAWERIVAQHFTPALMAAE